MEVDEASTLRLLGAEQENAELKRRLEELQTQQEVSDFTLRAGTVCNGSTSNPSTPVCLSDSFEMHYLTLLKSFEGLVSLV